MIPAVQNQKSLNNKATHQNSIQTGTNDCNAECPKRVYGWPSLEVSEWSFFKVNLPFTENLCLSPPGRESPVITASRSTTANSNNLLFIWSLIDNEQKSKGTRGGGICCFFVPWVAPIDILYTDADRSIPWTCELRKSGVIQQKITRTHRMSAYTLGKTVHTIGDSA